MQTMISSFDTRDEAFNTIDCLGYKQKKVYDCILLFGPINNREISLKSGLPINCVTPRCKELREMGLVLAGEIVVDNVTGRRTVTWVTRNKNNERYR